MLYLMKCTLPKQQAYLNESEGDSHCPNHNQVLRHKGCHTVTAVAVVDGLEQHDLVCCEAVGQSDVCTVTGVGEKPCCVYIGRVQPVLIGAIATAHEL